MNQSYYPIERALIRRTIWPPSITGTAGTIFFHRNSPFFKVALARKIISTKATVFRLEIAQQADRFVISFPDWVCEIIFEGVVTCFWMINLPFPFWSNHTPTTFVTFYFTSYFLLFYFVYCSELSRPKFCSTVRQILWWSHIGEKPCVPDFRTRRSHQTRNYEFCVSHNKRNCGHIHHTHRDSVCCRIASFAPKKFTTIHVNHWANERGLSNFWLNLALRRPPVAN